MKEIKLSVNSDAQDLLKVIPTSGSTFLNEAHILEGLAHCCFLLTVCRSWGQVSWSCHLFMHLPLSPWCAFFLQVSIQEQSALPQLVLTAPPASYELL